MTKVLLFMLSAVIIITVMILWWMEIITAAEIKLFGVGVAAGVVGGMAYGKSQSGSDSSKSGSSYGGDSIPVDFEEHGKRLFELCSAPRDESKLTQIKDLIDRNGVKKVNIEWRDKNGRTPLMAAVMHEHLDVVKYLIKIGADVNAVSQSGSNAIHLAIGHYYMDTPLEMIKTLVEAGTNPNLKNNDGKSALDIARLLRSWEDDTIEYLHNPNPMVKSANKQ